jgi:hypothetical protein
MKAFIDIEQYDEVTPLAGRGFVLETDDLAAENLMPVVGWLKKFWPDAGKYELFPLVSVGNGEVYAINTWAFFDNAYGTYRYFETREQAERWAWDEAMKLELEGS